jgi:hypothetical protein
VDVGFLFNRANGLVSNVALYWSEATQSFVTAYTNATGVTNANVTATSFANIRTGNITANGFFWSNGTVFSSGSTFTGGYVQNTIIAAANLVANSGTSSTSTTTGALVVKGGAGITGNIYLGGNLIVGTAPYLNTGVGPGPTIVSSTYLLTTSSGADLMYTRRQAAGVFQTQTFNGSNTGTLALQPYGGQLTVGLGETATSFTLDVVGTANVSSNISIGGNISSNSTANSTSTTTGA